MALALGRLGAGVARVPIALGIGHPGHRAAGGRVLHAVDRRLELLAVRHVIDVQRAVLAAVLGERHRDLGAIRRGRVPVDLGMAARVQDVGVQHVAPRTRVGRRIHDDQPGLLPGGVLIEGEDVVGAGLKAGDLGRGRLDHAADLLGDGLSSWQGVEVGPCADVLGVAPGLHLGIVGVLQRAVGIGDFLALDRLDRVALRKHRSRRQGRCGHGRARRERHDRARH